MDCSSGVDACDHLLLGTHICCHHLFCLHVGKLQIFQEIIDLTKEHLIVVDSPDFLLLHLDCQPIDLVVNVGL